MIALIMAGGGGTRLWPISTNETPKQFISLIDNKSLLELTIERILSIKDLNKIIISTNVRYHKIVTEISSKFTGIKFDFIFEEYKKDNSIITYLCSYLNRCEDILISPCDHILPDFNYFSNSISQNVNPNKITLFGISPTYPSTDYGYIQVNGANVVSFHEKPDYENAVKFVSNSNYLWNSGFFLSNTEFLLKKYGEYSIYDLDLLSKIISNSFVFDNNLYLSSQFTAEIDSISFDFDIIEKMNTSELSVVHYVSDWKDIGSYRALSEMHDSDPNNNTSNSLNNTLFVNCSNSFANVNNKPIIINDLNDIGVIDSDDVLFVFNKNHSCKNQMQCNANWLDKKVDLSRRPWGHYDILLSKPNFLVKKLVILPKHSISKQYHKSRTEHWVIVSGEGLLLLNNSEKIVRPNDQILIQIGDIHKVSNISESELLIIIEVQFGDFLSEHDITRVEDSYGRL